jgi:hypothetical protein
MLLDTLNLMKQNFETQSELPIKWDSLKRSERFVIPEKLYGREEDMSKILTEFNSVISGANKKCISFVSGISGVGKSEFTREVSHMEIAELSVSSPLSSLSSPSPSFPPSPPSPS